MSKETRARSAFVRAHARRARKHWHQEKTNEKKEVARDHSRHVDASEDAIE
jgi:hypothetical protein